AKGQRGQTAITALIAIALQLRLDLRCSDLGIVPEPERPGPELQGRIDEIPFHVRMTERG
ncbi:MAG: hypothetical protein MUO76_21030, partial [Anaerolineaceae bacterium]|nr:hypothetical protein [Anaerolineaceae bacterium]